MISRQSSKYMTMPLHVTNADLEDAEMEEALELNSAEDKMPTKMNAVT
jgi:hypothetical protein